MFFKKCGKKQERWGIMSQSLTVVNTQVSEVANAMAISDKSAQKNLVKYGKLVEYAIELKKDKLPVSLNKISALVEIGITPEQVITLYQTRNQITEYVQSQKFKCCVTLRQMARLSVRFGDFKEFSTDEQYEQIVEIMTVFKWTSFIKAVDRIIAVADDLGFYNLGDLLQAGEDYMTGEIFEYYFPDEDCSYEH